MRKYQRKAQLDATGSVGLGSLARSQAIENIEWNRFPARLGSGWIRHQQAIENIGGAVVPGGGASTPFYPYSARALARARSSLAFLLEGNG